jgi:hypothetical protein
MKAGQRFLTHIGQVMEMLMTLCIYKVDDILLSILPHQTLKTPGVLSLSRLLTSLPCFLYYILILLISAYLLSRYLSA